ncbi:MAG: T9SS type A sorting domain-containing protein [Bacteroidota bacterium]|nr:T9SS type A sorting domain-containing protein [Bacteroidota bacterium]
MITSDVAIAIYDLRGALVMEQNFPHSDHLPLDLSGLQDGAYQLQIRSETSILSQRIMIIR